MGRDDGSRHLVGEVGGGRRPEGHDRHGAERHHRLGQHRPVEGNPGHREARGRRRVGVHDRPHVRAPPVDGGVHQDLARRARAGQGPSLEIGHDHVLGPQEPLAGAAGGHVEAVACPDRDVALVAGDEALRVQAAPDLDDVRPDRRLPAHDARATAASALSRHCGRAEVLLATRDPGDEGAGAGHVGVADAVEDEVLGGAHLRPLRAGGRAGPAGPGRERAGHGAHHEAQQEQPEQELEDPEQHADHFPAVARICSIRLRRPWSCGSAGWRFRSSSHAAAASAPRPICRSAMPLL